MPYSPPVSPMLVVEVDKEYSTPARRVGRSPAPPSRSGTRGSPIRTTDQASDALCATGAAAGKGDKNSPSMGVSSPVGPTGVSPMPGTQNDTSAAAPAANSSRGLEIEGEVGQTRGGQSRWGIFNVFAKRVSSASHHNHSTGDSGGTRNPLLSKDDEEIGKGNDREEYLIAEDNVVVSINKIDQDCECTVVSGDGETASTSKDSAEEAVRRMNRPSYTQELYDKWESASEEAPQLVRVPAIFLSMIGIANTILLWIFDVKCRNLTSGICGFYFIALCSLILFLELFRREVVSAPAPETGWKPYLRRLHNDLRHELVRSISTLRLLWGRGCIYIFAASMSLALGSVSAVIVGCGLVACGLVAIVIGVHAAVKLAHLKAPVTDDVTLWRQFLLADRNKDGKIDRTEFSTLLSGCGIELDDFDADKAFKDIVNTSRTTAKSDDIAKANISFSQFKSWLWKQHTHIVEACPDFNNCSATVDDGESLDSTICDES